MGWSACKSAKKEAESSGLASKISTPRERKRAKKEVKGGWREKGGKHLACKEKGSKREASLCFKIFILYFNHAVFIFDLKYKQSMIVTL